MTAGRLLGRLIVKDQRKQIDEVEEFKGIGAIRRGNFLIACFHCACVGRPDRDKTEAIVISAVNTRAHATVDVVVDVWHLTSVISVLG